MHFRQVAGLAEGWAGLTGNPGEQAEEQLAVLPIEPPLQVVKTVKQCRQFGIDWRLANLVNVSNKEVSQLTSFL